MRGRPRVDPSRPAVGSSRIAFARARLSGSGAFMNRVLKEKLAWTEPDAERERLDSSDCPTG